MLMKPIFSLILLTGLAACQQSALPAPPETSTPGTVISLGAIETDATGRCFARMAGPVQTTIVTELVEVMPAERDRNGVVTSPAIFRNVTRPQTVQTGPGARFETLCPQRLTADFVATLQRALIVRRAFAGPVTGNYDDATSLAVQQFQRNQGIDSPLLSIDVARQFGLVAAVTR